MRVPAPNLPDGLDEALSLIRAAMAQAAKRRVRPDVAVWALVLEAVRRLTEMHGAQGTAEFLASLQAELQQAETSGDGPTPRPN